MWGDPDDGAVQLTWFPLPVMDGPVQASVQAQRAGKLQQLRDLLLKLDSLLYAEGHTGLWSVTLEVPWPHGDAALAEVFGNWPEAREQLGLPESEDVTP